MDSKPCGFVGGQCLKLLLQIIELHVACVIVSVRAMCDFGGINEMGILPTFTVFSCPLLIAVRSGVSSFTLIDPLTCAPEARRHEQ